MDVQIYVGYEDVFQVPSPEDRIMLIEDFSKGDLLGILSLINLNPKKHPIYHYLEWDDQIRILAKICIPNRKLFSQLHGIHRYNKSLLQQGASGVLFSRVANIVAMNEILESNRIPFKSDKKLDARKFIEYYLLVNSFIKREHDKYNQENRSLLDSYLAMALFNEYDAPFFSFLELFRGVELIKFMQNDRELGTDFNAYFAAIGIDPYTYFPLVFSHIIPTSKKIVDDFPAFKPINKLVENVIKTLSDQDIISSNPIEALNLKKNPFYNFTTNIWLLLDEPFLIDHCFYFTINSFWFSHLKNTGYSHKSYFGKIGGFYETYIAEIIKRSFHFLNNPAPKTLNDLKIRNKKNEQIEVADVYVRENENILIAEIKSTSYGAGFKYASDVISVFKENKSRFIKDFGLSQVLSAIKLISEHHHYIDENIGEEKKFQIFPAIIFSERLFQTPIANLFFQNLFLDFFTEMVGEFERPKYPINAISFRNFVIHPISLIHTTELEILEPLLANKRVDFWQLLLNHQRNWNLTVPLYYTVLEHAPHDLVEYTYQKIKPIIEDYEKRRKELLGD